MADDEAHEQRIELPLVRNEPRVFGGRRDVPPRPHLAPPLVTGTLNVVLDDDTMEVVGGVGLAYRDAGPFDEVTVSTVSNTENGRIILVWRNGELVFGSGVGIDDE